MNRDQERAETKLAQLREKYPQHTLARSKCGGFIGCRDEAGEMQVALWALIDGNWIGQGPPPRNLEWMN